MKLNELVNINNEPDQDDEEQESEQPGGTYAAVQFSTDTMNAIQNYQQYNNIPNCVPPEKLHTTLLYSRKHLPEYKAAGNYTKPMYGEAEQLEIWPTRPDENGECANCLVLRFKCNELCERHNSLMDQHQATYDFPTYIPHITFSYDAGDIDTKQLSPYKGPIEIVKEYQEDLTDTLQKNRDGE